MKKLDKFLNKHFANIALVITFTIIILNFIILGRVVAGWKLNPISTTLVCTLLICDWIYLIRCWRKEK